MREDVLDDFTTLELARDAYGVALTEALDVDEAATEELRAQMRKRRNGGSLTEWYEGRLPQTSAPTSVAGNSEFGLS